MASTGPEIEGKILDTTEKMMLPKLTELGFIYYSTAELTAQWLINPANGEKLRVRRELHTDTQEDIVVVEHKELVKSLKKSGLKANQETGFEARNFDDVIRVFEKIGFEKAGLPSVKNRVSYVLEYNYCERVRLDFDTYTNLMGKTIPEFMEIEATTAERVYEIAHALGFQELDCLKIGPVELFKHYYPNEEVI